MEEKRAGKGLRRMVGMRLTLPAPLPGAILCVLLILTGCAAPSPAAPPARGAGLAASISATTFDPNVGAPLPDNRIVAAYGIVGGFDANGPASTVDMLTNFYPQLQQLGSQYAAADPTHPVKLAIDLVVNVFTGCGNAPQYCSGWPNDLTATLQPYLDFCQKHNMLLFLDVQLGTEPVEDAVMNHVLTYLEKYSFVELALDLEFHYPNTPEGLALANEYPNGPAGSMSADEINWAINELAQIPMKYHLPRKVLVLNQWYRCVFDVLYNFYCKTDQKDQIQTNPDVSLVLQSDGFGAYGNKLDDYYAFVQQDLLEYGGYKAFYYYPDSAISYDYDDNGDKQVQSPQQIMQVFPEPLYISYQ